MESLFLILVFGGIILMTAVIFAIWVIVSIIKLIVRGTGAMLSGGQPAPRVVMNNQRVCPHPNCGAANLSDANFCRRCGRAMPGAQRIFVRRAAMF